MGEGGQGRHASTFAASRRRSWAWVSLLLAPGRQKASEGLTYHEIPR